MKPALHHKTLNGPFGDPCLLIRTIREQRCLLFDLGDISGLSPSVLNRVTEVFVTHTHIDHFIGFDSLLRASLRRTAPLTICGPAGIIRNVQGRLSGYAWNLIEQYPLSLTVFEYTGRSLTQALFCAEDRFRKKVITNTPSDGRLLNDSSFTVRAAVLDHGIPCLAYAIQEKLQVNIDKDRLLKKGLTVGPWLTLLKRQVREGRTRGSIMIDNRRFRTRDLLDIVRTAKGRKICYAADAAMSRRNSERLCALAEGADVLYCEAYFMEKDRGLSLERRHLTVRECGRIARLAGVKRLVLTHVSPRYSHAAEEVLREAEDAFGGEVSY